MADLGDALNWFQQRRGACVSLRSTELHKGNEDPQFIRSKGLGIAKVKGKDESVAAVSYLLGVPGNSKILGKKNQGLQ